MAEEPIPQWVLIQKKTFTKWMNGHLKKKNFGQITDAQTEFDTGTNLMNLVNALYDLPIPKHNKAPKMRAHKLDNAEVALKMLSDAKVKTNFLGTGHLVDHDLKMLMGMIWAIILDYQIKGISVENTSAREGLLLWCQMKTKGYKDVNVKNFTDSWTDGLGFCALINKFRPDLIDFNSLSKDNPEHNLALAFKIADEQLGIPPLLDVEDMKNPDEKSVMTYLSEYYHKFSNMEMDVALIARIKRFLQLVKSCRELKSYYDQTAPGLVQWLHDSIAWITEMKYKNDLDHCKDELNRLIEFQSNEKTQRIGEKFTCQGKFQNLQALQGANRIPLYQPPAGCDPATIEDLWKKLEEAENARANTLKEQLRHHFENVFKTFDKDGNKGLNLDEFKAVLNALGLAMTDQELKDLFDKCAADGEGVKKLSFDDFLDFMMQFISTVDGPEDIKKSFKWIAKQKDWITSDDLNTLALESDLYNWTIGGAMPKKGDGFDYVNFTDAAFRGE